MDKVQVLMSTYNGEAYIEEQLKSILQQTYHNIVILIRDDGSSDNTVLIIQKFMGMYPDKFRFIKGSNVGVIQSFFNLMHSADLDASYFCFCDQDDVWMNDKVERSVQLLHLCDTAGMYFSPTMLADQNLSPIKVWPAPPKKDPHFYNAIVQNIAVGATMAINKAARDLIVSKTVNMENLQMHDWWVYLCVSAFGKVYYDERPTIYYRQHNNNVIGGHRTILHELRSKWRSFRNHSGHKLLKKQAVEFNKTYVELLDAEKLDQLQLFIQDRKSIREKYQFLQKSKLYRNSFLENQLFKFLILIDYV
ncbi:glycosyltransferase family 2 protein [Paenibacillus riograndensis]|uniref:Glycosyl transferase family 2 n=1 Tax=Paenibacillus riograndensis SBR5 TaxID=1073571 RepID=A0A0E4CZH4_9BACL|nr:glycosyltransferase family 2 protein [Paenibacillus riograndensis]CQR58539.1 glycosyl transferase family 2 [Paenibacillus riograndensis SBR5]